MGIALPSRQKNQDSGGNPCANDGWYFIDESGSSQPWNPGVDVQAPGERTCCTCRPTAADRTASAYPSTRAGHCNMGGTPVQLGFPTETRYGESNGRQAGWEDIERQMAISIPCAPQRIDVCSAPCLGTKAREGYGSRGRHIVFHIIQSNHLGIPDFAPKHLEHGRNWFHDGTRNDGKSADTFICNR